MQASSTKKTKDSIGRRLGVKRMGGNEVFPMDILVRQRGFRWHPGHNTYVGRDHTIHAKVEGTVKFTRDPWRRRKKVYVHVEPSELPSRRKYKTTPPPPFCYHPELFPELAKNNPPPSNLKIPKHTPKPKKAKVTGQIIEKSQQSAKIYVPAEYMCREERIIPDEGEQFRLYLEQIDQMYCPQLEQSSKKQLPNSETTSQVVEE